MDLESLQRRWYILHNARKHLYSNAATHPRQPESYYMCQQITYNTTFWLQTFCWNHFIASSLVRRCWKPTMPVFLRLCATLKPEIIKFVHKAIFFRVYNEVELAGQWTKSSKFSLNFAPKITGSVCMDGSRSRQFYSLYFKVLYPGARGGSLASSCTPHLTMSMHSCTFGLLTRLETEGFCNLSILCVLSIRRRRQGCGKICSRLSTTMQGARKKGETLSTPARLTTSQQRRAS